MCLRFIQQLPPTITSLKLGVAIQKSQELLAPYLQYLVSPSSITQEKVAASDSKLSYLIDDNLIPETWPSIAASLPSLLHWLPVPSICSKNCNLGRGSMSLFQQLISTSWGPSYWEYGYLVLQKSSTLQHLNIRSDVLNQSKKPILWPDNLQSLKLSSDSIAGVDQPCSKGQLTPSPSSSFPSTLRYLSLDVFTGLAKSAAALPPLLQLDISKADFGFSLQLDQLPRTLLDLKMKWKRSVANHDFSGLPPGLKALKLIWDNPGKLTPRILSTLSAGLVSLTIEGSDDAIAEDGMKCLPRGLTHLQLSKGIHIKSDAVPFLPPYLQVFSARMSVFIKDEDLSRLPASLQRLDLGSFQTSGSLFPRGLKRLTPREVMETWRACVPEGLRHESSLRQCCSMAFSMGLSSLPQELEKIDLRQGGIRFATLQTLSEAHLPSLKSLKIPHFGFKTSRISPTLQTLVISESTVLDMPSASLISKLKVLTKLSLSCEWNWSLELPKNLEYLRLGGMTKIFDGTIQNHKNLKTVVFQWGSGSLVPLHILPASITKFVIEESKGLLVLGNFGDKPFDLPHLATFRTPFSFTWKDLLLLPKSLTSLKVVLQKVTSDLLLEWLTESQWKTIQGLTSLADPTFANTVLQAHFPLVTLYRRALLDVSWKHDHYHLIPKLISSLKVAQPDQPIVLAPSRELYRTFAQLPSGLTSLSLAISIITPHSIPKWLPRTLERLEICVDHWNVQSFQYLPTSLSAFNMSYSKPVTVKFMAAIPRTILALSISSTIDEAAVPLLPPNLTSLELFYFCGLRPPSLRNLPTTLTALKIPTYGMDDLHRYLPAAISHLDAETDKHRYHLRIFEDLYALPPLSAGKVPVKKS
jgi:hypothetical protein